MKLPVYFENNWILSYKKYDTAKQEEMETLFMLGNARFGQRASFEEKFSGNHYSGNYYAGIYEYDKPIMGWYKIGYTNTFCKIINGPDWLSIDLIINNEMIDANHLTIHQFKMSLNLQEGILTRKMTVQHQDMMFTISSEKFISLADPDIAAIKYSIHTDNKPFLIKLIPKLEVNNITHFWRDTAHLSTTTNGEKLIQWLGTTKNSNFNLATSFAVTGLLNDKPLSQNDFEIDNETLSMSLTKQLAAQETLTVIKLISNVSSFFYPQINLLTLGEEKLKTAINDGYDKLKLNHIQTWAQHWQDHDVIIEGDDQAQQGIRFTLFHLRQSFSGEHPLLNIAPKGLTGEKYGGGAYWDTEIYGLPYYLLTEKPEIARNLLLYRYYFLDQAIHNAQLLGFHHGEALYPFVSMEGNESHQEWEISFEEIHRNGAMVYAIYNYIKHTNDDEYLINNGLKIIIAIARFWAARANFSKDKNQYVILGVTGPNEYENNINNNWYTNFIAVWTLKYAIGILNEYNSNSKVLQILNELKYKEDEKVKWIEISENMYFPFSRDNTLKLQQDNFLDKIIEPISFIPVNERPLNQHWSWDRILRSCYIKQADTLMIYFLFPEQFTREDMLKHYQFYEPLTVHESSLSPCIHGILAAHSSLFEEAYHYFIKSTHIDLNDDNNELMQGLHITSMVGGWLILALGLCGIHVNEKGELHLAPKQFVKWQRYAFSFLYHHHRFYIDVNKKVIKITTHAKSDTSIFIYKKAYVVSVDKALILPMTN